MKEQDNKPNRFKKLEGQGSRPILQPIDISLQKYPRRIKTNYPKLNRKDLHLAEVYRVASKGTLVTPLERKLNPLQTKVDGKGRIWVDVLLERKKRVKIADLRKIMKVHGTPGRSRFVSGRVKVDNLPRLNQKALRLQTARPVESVLNKSVKTISANRTRLVNEGFDEIKGTGVIIGIVDEGCDFNHPNFKKNGKTRLLYLWDQNGKKGTGKHHPDRYNYGIEYDRQRINQALAAGIADPYDNLDYEPDMNAHGTHVMDIAAGSSPNPDYLGVAPDADLIFVHLGSPTTVKKIAQEEMKTLGSSNYLYDAVNYIFEKADIEKKPAVVNISLAGNGGSHDGSSLLEKRFDELLKKPGRAIVIAAGNDYQKKSHTSGTITSENESEISWVVPKADDPDWKFRQELEIWYPRDKSLNVEVFMPDGDSLQSCRLGEILKSDESDITPLWLISHNQAEPELDKDENYIHVLVDNRSDDFVGGEWRLKLSVESASSDQVIEVNFHAWVEYNLGKPSTMFADNSITDFTINGIGNATLPLVVGSFYPSTISTSYTASYFSSAGPSRNPQFPNKPEVSAPGENISSAQAGDDDLFDMTGTSAAAPHVAGVIALMFQTALGLPQPKTMNMQEIRDVLIATADRNPSLNNNGYHPQLGFGRINAVKALKQITLD